MKNPEKKTASPTGICENRGEEGRKRVAAGDAGAGSHSPQTGREEEIQGPGTAAIALEENPRVRTRFKMNLVKGRAESGELEESEPGM